MEVKTPTLLFYRRLAASSFMTVSGLSPTFAMAAAISCSGFPSRLRQIRADSLLETRTRLRGTLAIWAPDVRTKLPLTFCS